MSNLFHTHTPNRPNPSHRHSPTHQICPTCSIHTHPPNRTNPSQTFSHLPDMSNLFYTLAYLVVLAQVTNMFTHSPYVHPVLHIHTHTHTHIHLRPDPRDKSNLIYTDTQRQTHTHLTDLAPVIADTQPQN